MLEQSGVISPERPFLPKNNSAFETLVKEILMSKWASLSLLLLESMVEGWFANANNTNSSSLPSEISLKRPNTFKRQIRLRKTSPPASDERVSFITCLPGEETADL